MCKCPEADKTVGYALSGRRASVTGANQLGARSKRHIQDIYKTYTEIYKSSPDGHIGE